MDINSLYLLPDVVRIIKWKLMCWTGLIARTEGR